MLPVSDFTVGNTITIAVAVYRDNLKKFLQLSLIAHLWLLVPIYGWARYFAIAAWMSKLSLNRLLDRQNNLEEKKYYKIRPLFLFFALALTNILVAVFLWFAAIVLFSFATVLLERTFNTDVISKTIETRSGIGYEIFFWSSIFLFFLMSIVIHSVFFVSDLCFEVEERNKLLRLLAQSYSTMKRYKIKVLIAISVAFSICFSSYIPVYLLYFLTGRLLDRFNLYEWEFFYYGIIPADLLTSIFVHAVALPFWQSLKAVTFYQLTNLERRYSLR